MWTPNVRNKIDPLAWHVVSFLKCNFNKTYDFCFYISLLLKILIP